MRRGSSRYRGGEEISSRAELDRESLPRKRSAGFHQLGIIVDGWHRDAGWRPRGCIGIRTRARLGVNHDLHSGTMFEPGPDPGFRLCFHVSRNAIPRPLRPSLVFAKRSNLSPQCLLTLCIIERFTEVCKLRTGYRPRGAEPPLFPGNGINFAGQFLSAKYPFWYPRIVRKL